MIGSDWPVCLLAGSYEEVFAAYRSTLDSLSRSERSEVLGGTAERVYGLQEA